MKNKIGLLLICSILCCPNILAIEECFTLVDLNSHNVIKQEGNICDVRFTPASTFKIALSLMGYDAKILKDTKNPEWQYRPEYKAAFPLWRSAHNPTTWIKDSCVWYSKVLTQKLGMEKFKHYIEILEYGNKDLSGGHRCQVLTTDNGLLCQTKKPRNIQVSSLVLTSVPGPDNRQQSLMPNQKT